MLRARPHQTSQAVSFASLKAFIIVVVLDRVYWGVTNSVRYASK
ncbi:MAG: hypothetical protein QM778_28885 [Myxococcales bacterium]